MIAQCFLDGGRLCDSECRAYNAKVRLNCDLLNAAMSLTLNQKRTAVALERLLEHVTNPFPQGGRR